MTKNKQIDNVIGFNRIVTEEEKLELANKVQVVNELTNDGIISDKERLRIIKKIIGE